MALWKRGACHGGDGSFCRHVDATAGRDVNDHLPNGALDELVALSPTAAPSEGPFTVGYAGNPWMAQGLGVVLDAAHELCDEDLRFVHVGRRTAERDLRGQRGKRRMGCVELPPGIPVSDVGAFLLSCDAVLVPVR